MKRLAIVLKDHAYLIRFEFKLAMTSNDTVQKNRKRFAIANECRERPYRNELGYN